MSVVLSFTISQKRDHWENPTNRECHVRSFIRKLYFLYIFFIYTQQYVIIFRTGLNKFTARSYTWIDISRDKKCQILLFLSILPWCACFHLSLLPLLFLYLVFIYFMISTERVRAHIIVLHYFHRQIAFTLKEITPIVT